MKKKKESFAKANKTYYEILDGEYRSDYENLSKFGAPQEVLDTVVELIKKTDASYYNSKNEYEEIRHKPINVIKYSNTLNDAKSDRTAQLICSALGLIAFGLSSSLVYSSIVNNGPLILYIASSFYTLVTLHFSGVSIKYTADAIKKIGKYESVVDDANRVNEIKERVR